MLPVDKVDFYEIYANIDILATQVLFLINFLPYTLKITQITIMLKLFSNLIPIRKNLPPNLNKGFYWTTLYRVNFTNLNNVINTLLLN